MSGDWRVWLQHLLPKDAVSACIYRIARSRRPWIRRPLTRWFARHYRVDLSEAAGADLDDYACFNEFFTRALKPGSRPLSGDADTVVSPADGMLTELGTIDAGRLLQAKGMAYGVADLLGETDDAVSRFTDGRFLTVYLAPHDYHRVHAPLDAALVRTRYIPGSRYSVNRATARSVERLFCRNERAVCWFDSARGPFAAVLVGALNVSSISTFNLGEIASGAAREWREPAPLPIARGAEIGRFNMGSTVVLLFARDMLDWRADLADGQALKVGVALGRLRPAAGTERPQR
jgi:phosphatidylserine decarboxylase